MDEKAKALLDQKKEHDQGGQLRNFVENQVEGTGKSVPEGIEATKDQHQDQQNRLKDQQNMRK
ncbi:hypothetical protein QWJ34_02825 [Saccharibacillus sp. CPCC 101409]|uniref:hypothetical protein n=1 Tax=Saccharibacillus sp. CPCC 101409 TaxID=3058041 RepID=UPI002673D841|nr:hypothetical protein [Saccharibacillus sp. CPCC 101409]MDO3408693.1 hypothetical protein [Saccharibacillus sp. CPCC 101409]